MSQEEFSPERLKLWRTSFAEGASDAEFGTFVELVRQTGLSPEARQIYLRSQWDKKKNRTTFAPLTGIDGYRLVADRTGKYAGNDDPVFDNEKSPHPGKATVTVYKIVGGMRCPFTASARWDQYYPGDAQGFMWKKMPHLMLGKCAEALALRKAFPAELSGLYTDAEMEQAGAAAVEAPSPSPAPDNKQRRYEPVDDQPPPPSDDPPPPGTQTKPQQQAKPQPPPPKAPANQPEPLDKATKYDHAQAAHRRELAAVFKRIYNVDELDAKLTAIIRKASQAISAEGTPIGSIEHSLREWGRITEWGTKEPGGSDETRE